MRQDVGPPDPRRSTSREARLNRLRALVPHFARYHVRKSTLVIEMAARIDVMGIVAAYEHKLVFTREDIDRLIATDRDYMWNQHLEGAKFQRIDGREPDERWKNSPGLLWDALVPYDATLEKIFAMNHRPEAWGGLASTPWYLSLFKA